MSWFYRPVPGTPEMENAGEDYKTSDRMEQYRVSRKAVYFAALPGREYLAFTAVTQAKERNASLTATGSCGKSLPIVRVRLWYGEEQYRDMTFEKKKNAAELMERLAAENPDIPMERDDRPLTHY